MSRTVWIVVGVVAVVAVLVVAGIAIANRGGKSSTEKWADSVCTSISTWKTQISQIAQDTATQLPTATSASAARTMIDGQLTKAEQATKTLGDELRAAGPPKTSDGQKAQETITSAVDQVKPQMEQARSQLQGLSTTDLSSFISSVSQIAGSLSQVSGTISTATQQLSQLDPGSELQKAVKGSKECKALGA
jgi:hypothetical protein